jgi:hypothetical protein
MELAWCRPFVIASVIVGAAMSLLAAGCGGGSPAQVANTPSSTTTDTAHGAVAFARCMRAHGLPKWPDPISGGVFDKAALQQTGYTVSQVRAVEDGACNQLLGGVSHPQPTVPPADRADYLKAADCMRTHGFPGFPDPTFQDNSVQTNIPSSVDQDSAQFKGAAAICTKLIPAGLPYSTPTGSN